MDRQKHRKAIANLLAWSAALLWQKGFSRICHLNVKAYHWRMFFQYLNASKRSRSVYFSKNFTSDQSARMNRHYACRVRYSLQDSAIKRKVWEWGKKEREGGKGILDLEIGPMTVYLWAFIVWLIILTTLIHSNRQNLNDNQNAFLFYIFRQIWCEAVTMSQQIESNIKNTQSFS